MRMIVLRRRRRRRRRLCACSGSRDNEMLQLGEAEVTQKLISHDDNNTHHHHNNSSAQLLLRTVGLVPSTCRAREHHTFLQSLECSTCRATIIVLE